MPTPSRWGTTRFARRCITSGAADPGGKIYEFLLRIGLEKEITFELMEKDGYDHVVLPDGRRGKIPYGFDRLARNRPYRKNSTLRNGMSNSRQYVFSAT